jgi:hypothetical protein
MGVVSNTTGHALLPRVTAHPWGMAIPMCVIIAITIADQLYLLC